MKRPIFNTVPRAYNDNEMSELFLGNEFEQSITQKERLVRECNAILKFHELRYRAALNFDDYKNWNCYIIGPLGTPYEGGIFFFRIEFDEETYPQKGPRVFFETRIDHPCIHVDGEVRFWNEWWNPKMQALDVFKQLDKLMIDFDTFVLQREWGNFNKGDSVMKERRLKASIFTKRYAAYNKNLEMNKLAKIEIKIKDNSCPMECYLDKITKTIFLNKTFKELTSAVGPDDWMHNTSVQISHKISLEDFLRIILSKDYDMDQLSSKSVDELLYMDDKLAKLFSDKL